MTDKKWPVRNLDPSFCSQKDSFSVGLSDASIRLYDLTKTISIEDGIHKRKRFEDFDFSFDNENLEWDTRSLSEVDRESTEFTKTGPHPCIHFRGHTQSITATSFFEDYGMFLSSSLDGTIRLWSESLQCNICVYKSTPIRSDRNLISFLSI